MAGTVERALTAALMLLAAGCAGGDRDTSNEVDDRSLVEVTARGLTFEAPSEIPAGWATFRFTNASTVIHFVIVERMPDGYGAREQQEQVAPIFQEGMDLLNAGDPDAALAKFGGLPAWFPDIVFMGGPGLTSPGHTAEATVYLEPGTYLLECYVKTNGIFHSFNPAPESWGMVHEFTVTPESSAAPEPQPTLTLTISSERGIEAEGNVAPGQHTVAVRFEDQQPYENFVGHDVHLVRLSDDTNIEALAAWMDWRRPDGLQSPAPAEFLGGTNEAPAGTVTYFTTQLEPGGRYAWIAEVANPAEQGMLKTFVVSDGSGPET